MRPEVRDQIVSLLAAEMEAYAGNLDQLEGQLLSCLREISQGALQASTAAKKGATQVADVGADAVNRPDSSDTDIRPSSR